MTTEQHGVVVLGYARTPFVKFAGAFSGVPAVALGTAAAAAALERAGVDPADIGHTTVGQVLQTGAGQNPARQVAVAAGVPMTSPAVTINAVCLSGIEAVLDVARRLRSGEVDVALAGGQESMTEAPRYLPHSRTPAKYGAVTLLDSTEEDGLTDAFEGLSMGASTERYADSAGISRAEQDQWALRSHRLAEAAADLHGREIIPVTVGHGRRQTTVTTDDGVRADTTAEQLAALRPSFDPAGSITAGNASPLTDGAAFLVLAREDWARQRGLQPLCRILGSATIGGPDTSLLERPADAIHAAARDAAVRVVQLEHVEINEAFAAVAVRSAAMLDVDLARINPHGGAVALGHPIGASGARIVGRIAMHLADRASGTLAGAAICGGGGQGSALIAEAV